MLKPNALDRFNVFNRSQPKLRLPIQIRYTINFFLKTHIMSTKKFPVPLSYFSMPLGLFALGLSWRYGARIGLLPTWAAETLLAAAFMLWLLLVIAYIIKIRFFRPEFLQDLQVWCNAVSSARFRLPRCWQVWQPYPTKRYWQKG